MLMSLTSVMLLIFFISQLKRVTSQTDFDPDTEEIQFLNELPLDKLLKLKTSIKDLAAPEYEYENLTDSTPSYLEGFGAQAMALRAPKRKSDYEEVWHKGESKISNIFSMSVTTLAFLAFGGYLLCLIVQAVKAKQMYLPATTPVTPTFFVSNIKKRPQAQVHSHAPVSSYGRRRRSAADQHQLPSGYGDTHQLAQLNLPPEQLFNALLHVCEGYARWSHCERF